MKERKGRARGQGERKGWEEETKGRREKVGRKGEKEWQRERGVERMKGGEKGRKEGKEEEKKHFEKISVRETKLPILKHRKGATFRRYLNRRRTVFTLVVITQELCLISSINEGSP